MVSKKLLLFFVAFAAAICMPIADVTFTYFQEQTKTKINQFPLGSVDVSIQEDFPKPSGNYAKKTVTLQNTGNVDAFLRAMLVPAFRSDEGSLPCDVDYSDINSGRIQVTTLNGGKIYTLTLVDKWQENWEFSPKNNVFYYRAKVAPGENTAVLLEGVETDADNWENLNIDILADAVQTEGDTLHQFLKDKWDVSSVTPGGMLVW